MGQSRTTLGRATSAQLSAPMAYLFKHVTDHARDMSDDKIIVAPSFGCGQQCRPCPPSPDPMHPPRARECEAQWREVTRRGATETPLLKLVPDRPMLREPRFFQDWDDSSASAERVYAYCALTATRMRPRRRIASVLARRTSRWKSTISHLAWQVLYTSTTQEGCLDHP